MNKTQDAFKPKENKLLEMFEDQKPTSNDRQKQNISENANENRVPEEDANVENNIEHAKTKTVVNEGGIVVKKQTEHAASLKGQLDKKFSNVTEIVGKQSQILDSIGPEKQIVVKEQLSETTANPSNLGNVSSIRDPRYS